MCFNLFKKNNWPQLIHAPFLLVTIINTCLFTLLQNLEMSFDKRINQDNTIISHSVCVIFILAQHLICLYFTFTYRPKKLA